MWGRRQALVVALALAAATAAVVGLQTAFDGTTQVADDPVEHPATRPMIMVPVR
jgi:hypothetical protein